MTRALPPPTATTNDLVPGFSVGSNTAKKRVSANSLEEGNNTRVSVSAASCGGQWITRSGYFIQDALRNASWATSSRTPAGTCGGLLLTEAPTDRNRSTTFR